MNRWPFRFSKMYELSKFKWKKKQTSLVLMSSFKFHFFQPNHILTQQLAENINTYTQIFLRIGIINNLMYKHIYFRIAKSICTLINTTLTQHDVSAYYVRCENLKNKKTQYISHFPDSRICGDIQKISWRK